MVLDGSFASLQCGIILLGGSVLWCGVDFLHQAAGALWCWCALVLVHYGAGAHCGAGWRTLPGAGARWRHKIEIRRWSTRKKTGAA